MMTTSGIVGLDEILGGGFVRGNCVLLHGGPGSGKTTFAIQFLYNGIVESNEPGVLVTLCENPDEIRRNMLSFGWDLKKLEKQKKLVIVDARPVTFTNDGLIIPNDTLFKSEGIPFSQVSNLIVQNVPFSNVSKLITQTMKDIGAKRMALDSITVLTSQFERLSYIRQGLLGFIQVLSNLDCTSLLLSEGKGNSDKTLLERALVQGVISLYFAHKGSSMARAVQVLKLRGQKHSSDIYHMEISDNGIVVHPEERLDISNIVGP